MQPFDMLRVFLILTVSAMAILTIPDFDVRADAIDDILERQRKSEHPDIVDLIASARAGAPAAHAFVGQALIEGRFGVVDVNLGAELLEKAARSGYAVAASDLAFLHKYGRGVPKDIAKATYWYEKAYEAGGICAALELAYISQAAKPYDGNRAVPWFEKCAVGGLRVCQERLAYLYLHGRDIPRDYAKSLRWLLEAVKPPDYSGGLARLAALQTLIGVQFENGLGISRNVPEAIEWYTRAAEADDSDAQYALGRLYEAGIDVPRDVGRGVEFFNAAALAGDVRAQYRLALAYERGVAVPRDRTLALKWLILALADRGPMSDQDAQLLGPFPRSLARTQRDEAERDLVRLKSELNSDQISAAESLAASFEPKLGAPAWCGPHGCPRCW
jgi:TPR repeat protein